MSKTKAGPVIADRLKSFVERIERLIEERQALNGDIRDVFSEAKGVGYDIKTMRKVIQLRGMDAADRDEQETLLDVYMHALGMVDRIEARAAAGESAREIATAENVSKSTAHRVSQKARTESANVETGQPIAAPEKGVPGTNDALQEENAATREGGIRTHGTPESPTPGEGAAINRSATSGTSADVSTHPHGTPPQPDFNSTERAPVTVEAGAEVRSTEPVPNPDADTLDFPAHLARRPRQQVPA